MTARLGIQVKNERVGKARHVVPMGRLDLLEADIVFGYRIAQPVVGFRVDQQVLMRGGGDRVDRTGGARPGCKTVLVDNQVIELRRRRRAEINARARVRH